MPDYGKDTRQFAELPPAEYLRKHYHYNPATGELYLKPKPNSSGNITIGYKTYKKARIAWMMHYGKEPNGFLYYKDGDMTNIAIDNLEEGPCRMIRGRPSFTRGKHLRKSKDQSQERPKQS